MAMTTKAIKLSSISRILPALGIRSLDSILPNYTRDKVIGSADLCLRSDIDEALTIRDIIRLGSFCEDATFTNSNEAYARYKNHFFDPVHGGTGLDTWYASGYPSNDWGLEPQQIAGQDYSYADFPGYLYLALTTKEVGQRQASMVSAFRTLGHVDHLIQDLAQPQHTRNDGHARGSTYERATDARLDSLPYDGYEISNIRMSGPEDLWHTPDERGLSDYSNAGFVGAGTNFRGTATNILPNEHYPLPDGSEASTHNVKIDDPDLANSCPGTPIPPQLHGQITFIVTPVSDWMSKAVTSNPRTSTYSIFDDHLEAHGHSRTFSLNRFTFCSAQELLIPRAVAYSAAFINYAFRGVLEIAMPNDGIYAVDNIYREDCTSWCGFKTVKASIRNATPNAEEMLGGDLVAIAHYHMNACYRPDLSGQPEGSSFRGVDCRTPTGDEALTEFISVSKPMGVASIPAANFLPVSFDFSSDPIPFAATDLSLQVVFTGQLGYQRDAVALGMVDLFEPTFLTFNNDNDYVPIYAANGKFLRMERYAPTVGDTPDRYSIVDLSLSTYVEGQTTPSLASFDRLDPGYFKRIAVLSDQPLLFFRIDYRFGNSAPTDFISQAYEIENSTLQIDSNRIWGYFPAYIPLRHSSPDDWIYHPSPDGSTIYWVPGYECADSIPCTPEETTVGKQVQRYPPFVQPTPQLMTIDFNDRP